MEQEVIRSVMTSNPVCISKDASVAEAARAMRDKNIGDVVVTEDGGQVRGILTDRDIVVRTIGADKDPSQIKVDEVCSHQLHTLSPSDSVDDAIILMEREAVRRVPVVENERVVGIVSIGDLAIDRDRHSALGRISAASPNR